MSVALSIPKRVRCINAEASFGQLVVGGYYTATHVWKNNEREMLALSEMSGWWNADRFAVENDAPTLDVIDCEYEEMTRVAPATGVAADAVSFDFDRYNSLAALPQIRKGDRT